MRPAPWKVGELAKRTGISVRTLHYYDEIGLLSPSHHTAAGYRLYTAGDVARLQQILSLRNLGFSLEQARDYLLRPGVSPLGVVQLHLARVSEEIEAQKRLRHRLEALAHHLSAAEPVSVEELFQTIEEITMFEKYYTTEQLETLKQRGEQIGAERIRQVEGEWRELIDQVQAEMDKGTDPASETVQALARRWRGLLEEFTGGDPGIEQSLGNLWKQEPDAGQRHGFSFDPALFEYVAKANAAAQKP